MLVLDANILIRAVLGSRVLSLLRKYEDRSQTTALIMSRPSIECLGVYTVPRLLRFPAGAAAIRPSI
jgi:predicted nucleic acid-binding protein